MRALKVQGANGESTEQLIEMLEDGKVLISTFDDAAAETNEVDMELPERLAGKKMFDGQSSVDVAPAPRLFHLRFRLILDKCVVL